MEIIKPLVITDEITDAFARLIPQLSDMLVIPDRAYLQKIVDEGRSFLFLAKVDNIIVGTLTLVIYQTPAGRKAWIEDVVVDEKARGKGVAQQLIETALIFAKTEGIQKVDLTSSSYRTEAHKLYEKMGFEKRETSVFRKLL